MNLEKNAQLSLRESKSLHTNNWATQDNSRFDQNESSEKPRHYREKLCASYSTPITGVESSSFDERNRLLKDIGQVRRDIARFRSEMDGLAKQMDGMEFDLEDSKDRVREIEEGLTATQEVNVNLQVLLERAVSKQKENDVNATRAMRHIHSNLATVVYETGQLRGRLSTIATCQKQYTGSVTDVAERMREYTHMLEQARGTIQSLEKPKELFIEETPKNEPSSRRDNVSPAKPVLFPALLEGDEDEEKEQEKVNTSKKTPDLYKHRIIRKRASNPEVASSPWLPQTGLRILLNDFK
ncbi:hypothetical protein K501DRAFT_287168 [Backusella circina FSU 941]|nr:hypothetical protein K501DRAFT_287168 [Backusella circina FSU 941]